MTCPYVPLFGAKIVTAKEGACQPPMYNEKAASPGECLRCFCFGVTDTCYSSNLRVAGVSVKHQYTVTDVNWASSQIPLRSQLEVVALRKDPFLGNYTNVSGHFRPNQAAVQYIPAAKEFRMDGTVLPENAPDDIYYYW